MALFNIVGPVRCLPLLRATKHRFRKVNEERILPSLEPGTGNSLPWARSKGSPFYWATRQLR